MLIERYCCFLFNVMNEVRVHIKQTIRTKGTGGTGEKGHAPRSGKAG